MNEDAAADYEALGRPAVNLTRRLGGVLFVFGLLGCWLILRPYHGIVGDAYLYVGHVMAEFDAQGVGQDWMFRDDGQMRFSIFPVVLRWLIAAFGPSAASKSLAFFALILWFAALVSLASALEDNNQKWLLVFFTVLVRSQYSPLAIFTAEPLAIPRPFAEAFALFALAKLIKGRDRSAIVLLMIAAALHPIMAMAGVGVLFLFKGWDDRRWLTVAAAAVAAFLAAAALKLPFASRLFTPMDAQWRHTLDPGLFPSSWNIDTLGVVLVDLATLTLAAWRLQGEKRRLFFAAAAVAAGGFAASIVAGDVLSSRLVIQAQPWRAAWLAAALAPAAMALLALDSKGRPPSYWLAPSLLALAWVHLRGAWCIFFVLAAALAEIGKMRFGEAPSRRIALASLAIGVLVSILAFWNAVEIAQHAPEPASALRTLVLAYNLQFLPLAVFASLFAFGLLRSPPALKIGFGLLSVALALQLWDSRSDYRRAIDAGRRIPLFASIIAQRPGEVFWGDGADETWRLLGRPNWLATIQSWSIVFSREHAMIWKARTDRLLALGLMKRNEADDDPTLTSGRLKAFCSSADAPSWVVWPIYDHAKAPLDVSPRAVWRAPDPPAPVIKPDGQVKWRLTTSFMLFACHGGASS